MARTITGVDVGARTALALQGSVKGNTLALRHFAAVRGEFDGLQAGYAALNLGFKPGLVRAGLSGRELNVRYTRVPRVPDWQLRKLMRFEVEEVGAQSELEVASDFNVLPEIPEIEGEDVVLLALARETLLDEHASGVAGVGGRLDALTPSSIALYNAWLRFGVLMEDTVLVANIGHDNLDIVIARGTDLLYARNLSGASRHFDEALAGRFQSSAGDAEQLKRRYGSLANDGAGGAQGEKVSRALLGPAGQLLGLMQSALHFCKTQVKLSGMKLDRVMICGGGAKLKGLETYLSSGLGVSVERFDPFEIVDTSALSSDEAELLDEFSSEAVCALGLATSGSDPDAYSIEIVPARIAKKREFWGRKAYLIGAALLLAGYVGFEAWRTRAGLEKVRTRVNSLSAQVDRARRTDVATQGLLEANGSLDALAQELYLMVGAGEQSVRVVEAISEVMPTGFWLTHASSRWTSDEELGIERGKDQPTLHFEGRAREGTTSVTQQFDTFVQGLIERVPEALVKRSLGATLTTFTLDVSLLSGSTSDTDVDSDSDEDAS